MKKVFLHSLVLLASAMQISCAYSPGSIDTKAGLEAISATLRVEDSGRIEGNWHSEEIMPYFGFIPGSIFGNPLKDIVLPTLADDELRITLDLADWLEMADTAAEPLSALNLALGLQIEPADTRILRVSTFAYDQIHDSGMGGAFRERGLDGYIVLVYVDKACEISGTIAIDGDEYTHDIKFPSKGFHFLLSDEENHLSARVTRKELLFVTNH